MTQKEALEILKLGHNVYLTGPAGSGKTFLLNKYISYLREKGTEVAITASTGIAATHINGITIHSWSGMGIKEKLTESDIQRLLTKHYLEETIQSAEVLIIDEISMLHDFQFDLVNRICQVFRRNTRPFGGIQVVCSGDFFQLPPVQKKGFGKVNFVTASETWRNMDIKICYLEEQHRNKDPRLLKILNEIRNNAPSKESLKLLLSRKYKEVSSPVKPTRLYTHNIDVDAVNRLELAKIKEKEFTYEMWSGENPKLAEMLKKNCLAPEKLMLKKGAVVMFLKNNFQLGYVNGTLGKVIDCDGVSEPIVETFKGNRIAVAPESWKMERKGRILAEIHQIPLRLAWAITIHKSQGMTLDAAEINLSKTFERGMGYVALSRVNSLDGIKLMGLNKMALEVNPSVIAMEKDLLKKSEDMRKYLKIITPGKQLSLFGEN